MTSATNRRTAAAATAGRAGFTLIELLLVVGILAVLAGILLPAVTRVWDRSIRIRTQADMQAISTALEAYKADFNGSYPPVTIANSGAAALGKALVGAGDAARYWTMDTSVVPAAMVPDDDLANPPDAFDPAKTYNAGDVVRVGVAPQFTPFTLGQNATIYISLRNNSVGHTPTGNVDSDYFWTRFLPYDGADGPGSRIRLSAAVDAQDRPHAPAGKVYGPYLDPERFQTRGPVLLDRNGSPILYFPVNKSAKTSAADGFVNRVVYPRPATVAIPFVNANDNLGVFWNSVAAAESSPSSVVADIAAARIMMTMGDYNMNGINDTGAGEPTPPAVPFVLWTAGRDGIFGPRGENATAAYSLKAQDFYVTPTAAQVPANAATSAAVDDVTNFR